MFSKHHILCWNKQHNKTVKTMASVKRHLRAHSYQLQWIAEVEEMIYSALKML